MRSGKCFLVFGLCFPHGRAWRPHRYGKRPDTRRALTGPIWTSVACRPLCRRQIPATGIHKCVRRASNRVAVLSDQAVCRPSVIRACSVAATSNSQTPEDCATARSSFIHAPARTSESAPEKKNATISRSLTSMFSDRFQSLRFRIRSRLPVSYRLSAVRQPD